MVSKTDESKDDFQRAQESEAPRAAIVTNRCKALVAVNI